MLEEQTTEEESESGGGRGDEGPGSKKHNESGLQHPNEGGNEEWVRRMSAG